MLSEAAIPANEIVIPWLKAHKLTWEGRTCTRLLEVEGGTEVCGKALTEVGNSLVCKGAGGCRTRYAAMGPLFSTKDKVRHSLFFVFLYFVSLKLDVTAMAEMMMEQVSRRNRSRSAHEQCRGVPLCYEEGAEVPWP